MSSKLVQIKTPPLRQSTAEVMGCRLSYVESFIKGRKQPGGLDSARGIQIHSTLGRYASWCAVKRVGQDLQAFDTFAEGSGLAAHKILVGVRDSYIVEWKSLFATELPMALDEDFNPTDIVEALDGIIQGSGNPVAYQGTLDTLYMFRDDYRINIDDFKSHSRPYSPEETLQGKMYSLFAFQHFPWVQEIKFRLVFVRYHRVYREVVYKRSDIPQLIEAVRSARIRQKMIHEDYANNREIEATAGTHCLGGETRFITKQGIRTLKEACGEKVTVLNRFGKWEEGEIRSFGIQKLMRITFDNGEVVRATEGHRWWKMRKNGKRGWFQTDERITTMELDRVPIVCFDEMLEMDDDGIRHGFVYGDGYKRSGRNSCIALIQPPKDEPMLEYFPGAYWDTCRYRKGGLPGHYKTLTKIESPEYARGFAAGIIAADGQVNRQHGAIVFCEGKDKSYAVAEVLRLGGVVVSAIRVFSSTPTKFSPKGTITRELMAIVMKPKTTPLLYDLHRDALADKFQMRQMYREVVSIEEDGEEEVYCATVPGSESFTLANGIATSNCWWCSLLSDASCPIGQYNAAMQLTMQQRLNFALWYGNFSRINSAVMKDYVQASGKAIVVKDGNEKFYRYGPEERESNVYPIFKKTADGLEKNNQGNYSMPIVELLLDHAYASPDDVEWMGNLSISATKLESYLKTKKRVFLHQSISDTADKITKVSLRVSKPLDAEPTDDDADEEDGQDEDGDF